MGDDEAAAAAGGDAGAGAAGAIAADTLRNIEELVQSTATVVRAALEAKAKERQDLLNESLEQPPEWLLPLLLDVHTAGKGELQAAQARDLGAGSAHRPRFMAVEGYWILRTMRVNLVQYQRDLAQMGQRMGREKRSVQGLSSYVVASVLLACWTEFVAFVDVLNRCWEDRIEALHAREAAEAVEYGVAHWQERRELLTKKTIETECYHLVERSLSWFTFFGGGRTMPERESVDPLTMRILREIDPETGLVLRSPDYPVNAIHAFLDFVQPEASSLLSKASGDLFPEMLKGALARIFRQAMFTHDRFGSVMRQYYIGDHLLPRLDATLRRSIQRIVRHIHAHPMAIAEQCPEPVPHILQTLAALPPAPSRSGVDAALEGITADNIDELLRAIGLLPALVLKMHDQARTTERLVQTMREAFVEDVHFLSWFATCVVRTKAGEPVEAPGAHRPGSDPQAVLTLRQYWILLRQLDTVVRDASVEALAVSPVPESLLECIMRPNAPHSIADADFGPRQVQQLLAFLQLPTLGIESDESADASDSGKPTGDDGGDAAALTRILRAHDPLLPDAAATALQRVLRDRYALLVQKTMAVHKVSSAAGMAEPGSRRQEQFACFCRVYGALEARLPDLLKNAGKLPSKDRVPRALKELARESAECGFPDKFFDAARVSGVYSVLEVLGMDHAPMGLLTSALSSADAARVTVAALREFFRAHQRPWRRYLMRVLAMMGPSGEAADSGITQLDVEYRHALFVALAGALADPPVELERPSLFTLVLLSRRPEWALRIVNADFVARIVLDLDIDPQFVENALKHKPCAHDLHFGIVFRELRAEVRELGIEWGIDAKDVVA